MQCQNDMHEKVGSLLRVQNRFCCIEPTGLQPSTTYFYQLGPKSPSNSRESGRCLGQKDPDARSHVVNDLKHILDQRVYCLDTDLSDSTVHSFRTPPPEGEVLYDQFVDDS